MKNFKKECIDWLKPFGYSVYTSSENSVIFMCYKNNYPDIECKIEKNGKKSCKLDNSNFKLFLTLSSGDIQFKHPHIEQYLKVFKHYADLVEKYPPF